jgi:hypothetical protein
MGTVLPFADVPACSALNALCSAPATRYVLIFMWMPERFYCRYCQSPSFAQFGMVHRVTLNASLEISSNCAFSELVVLLGVPFTPLGRSVNVVESRQVLENMERETGIEPATSRWATGRFLVYTTGPTKNAELSDRTVFARGNGFVRTVRDS